MNHISLLNSISKRAYQIQLIFLTASIFSLLFSPIVIYGQDELSNESCLDCHSDPELTGEIEGVEVSVYVNSEAYQNSVHADFACIDCHMDIEESPHAFDLERVDCANCHFDSMDDIAESVHAIEEGPSCLDCHGNAHEVLPPSNPESLVSHQNIVLQCSECHMSDVNADLGEAEQPESATAAEQVDYMHSIHGEAVMAGVEGAANCVDCHGAHKILSHENPESQVNHFNVHNTCAQCHTDITETYINSIHGQTVLEGSPDAANCTSCHGEHSIVHAEQEGGPGYPQQVYNMCGECHFDVALMDKYGLASAEQETLFKGSVHAEEVMKGNEDAPTCISCHGFHDVLPLKDPDSPSNFMNVAETCGQCHTTEHEQFQESVHGVSAARGHKDAPVCTDCHGEHAILSPEDERSPVSFANLSENTCGRCHSSIVINDKYGIASGKVENYFDSYHGLALQHGSKTVANCGSCHANHLILSSDNPRSTVSSERLVETCGKCHPGISTNVLAAPIHSDITLRSDLIAAWVPRIYLLLIVVVIGGMILHNGIILWALFREKYQKEKSNPSYTRFTTFEIWMHILLTISFIALVITGFALVNPKAWWVTLLSYMYMDETVRSVTHRVAGVILIITSFMYAFYMIGSKRGRSEFVAFFPRWSDFVHPFQHLAYYMGKRSTPPKFDRYDYTEKMEFWALVWGVIIMAVTGLMLWFPIVSLQYLPKWAIDMAELVHYYEAVLATLAIVIWHFFFVIFHPEEYPMSTTWLTGKMELEHLKHRHPKEYERLQSQNVQTEEGKASE